MAEEAIPTRTKEEGGAAAGALPAPPSKNALKKAQKEKEKAEKAAARKAAEDKQKAEAAANDVSTNDYGDLPTIGSKEYKPSGDKRTTLRAIAETFKEGHGISAGTDAIVVFRAVAENAREQSAKLAFLNLGHRGYTIQAVIGASETLSRQMVKFAGRIPVQSEVLVYGTVKEPREPVKSATISWLEIHITRLFVIARAHPLAVQVEDCERPLPEDATGADSAAEVSKEDGRPVVSLNTRLNNRTIDLMAKVNASIFAIKDGVNCLFQEFLRSKDFVSVHTPKLQGASAEGGSAVFPVKYFNTEAFLAQSPQFYKQMLIAAKFERVFEIGPVFRAENSNTARHLTEFMGLDLEMAFEENYHEVIDLLEELLLYIFNGIKTGYAKEVAIVRQTYPVEEFKLPEAGKTPRIAYSEGVRMLREAGVEIGDFDDISTPQEKLLGRLVLEKYGTDFYILDQYPLATRPFYTMPSPDNPKYSNSYDFHMRGQEILSGAQRVHEPTLLAERLRSMDPPLDPTAPAFSDYVDAFKLGCPPHGGAGIGMERIVMLWLGLPNIRLASLYPRDPGRLMP